MVYDVYDSSWLTHHQVFAWYMQQLQLALKDYWWNRYRLDKQCWAAVMDGNQSLHDKSFPHHNYMLLHLFTKPLHLCFFFPRSKQCNNGAPPLLFSTAAAKSLLSVKCKVSLYFPGCSPLNIWGNVSSPALTASWQKVCESETGKGFRVNSKLTLTVNSSRSRQSMNFTNVG